MSAPTKADAQAAERLLRAAVRTGARTIATYDGRTMGERTAEVVVLFTEACHAADLLLDAEPVRVGGGL